MMYTTYKKKNKKGPLFLLLLFLLLQATWLAGHFLGWVTYAAYVLLRGQEDVVFRLWLPLLAPLLLLPPLLAALHWAVGIAPLYSSRSDRKDTLEQNLQTKSLVDSQPHSQILKQTSYTVVSSLKKKKVCFRMMTSTFNKHYGNQAKCLTR